MFFIIVELSYGLISGSLALLSDAGHRAADVVAHGAALVATRMATRPDTTGRRTYGSYRAEVSSPTAATMPPPRAVDQQRHGARRSKPQDCTQARLALMV